MAIVGAMFRMNMAQPRRFTIAINAPFRACKHALPVSGAEAGVFEQIFKTLAQDHAAFQTLMIDATHALPGSGLPFANHERSKTHRIAANGVKKTKATGAQ